MKFPLIAAVLSLALLAGCTNTQLTGFFGTSDPCVQGSLAHSTFKAVAATQPRLQKYVKAESAGYKAFQAQCADGNLSKVTLQKALAAYLAAVADYKS